MIRAADDYDAIRGRLAELRAEREIRRDTDCECPVEAGAVQHVIGCRHFIVPPIGDLGL